MAWYRALSVSSAHSTPWFLLPLVTPTRHRLCYTSSFNTPWNARADRFNKMRRVPALLLLLLFSSMPVLRGQSTSASLSGRVTDPSHALISDARVSAINTATNFHHETMTNSSGEYYLTDLPPGR